MKGRRGRGRGKSFHRDFGKNSDAEHRKESKWLDDSQFHNERFEAYYKRQGIVQEEEWEAFLESARKELPVVFRINGRGPYALGLREKLETDFFAKLANAGREEDGAVAPPKPLPWYPDHLAWQFDFSRRELRRDPAFEALHEYIKHETASGNISRQEAVSMIPPVVLDVQSHHRVLDMCAAPGSKTVQLLEMLHGDQMELPTGYVIANDVDFQRCNMMTHQVKRMISPNIAITSADAALFPNGAKVSPDRKVDRTYSSLSRDGTTRKNPEVWRKWKLHDACGLHPLQLRIALRGVKLLAVGGLMVYSTCSLNPLEDEAVVAEVIRQTGGAMELIDLTTKLPQLKSCPGKQTWIVQDDNREYDNYETAVEVRQSMQKKIDIDPSFFPPKEREDIPLERCLRLLPHMNNSGGFFVALFQKKRPVEDLVVPSVQHRIEACPTETKREYLEGRNKRLGKDPKERSSDRPAKEKSELVEGQYFRGVDPIISLDGHSVAQEVTEFYGLEGVELGKNLISRNLNNNEPRKVYFISSAIKALTDAGYDSAIRITSLGQQVLTRAFQRKEGSKYRCIYRFCQEGLPLVLPYITKQKLYLKSHQMKQFLTEKTIKIRNPNNEENPATCADPEIIKKFGEMEQGGCVILLEDSESARLGLPSTTEAGAGVTSHAPLAACGWLISPFTLNLMVQKEDLTNLLKKLEEMENQFRDPNGADHPEPETERPKKDIKKPKLDNDATSPAAS